MFFSHTIKAQEENMKLLDTCLERDVRLIDYECVRADGDTSAPRLIAFGEFAGKSGLINGLRGLGARLLALGHSTPFLSIGATYSYPGEASQPCVPGGRSARRHSRGIPIHATATPVATSPSASPRRLRRGVRISQARR